MKKYNKINETKAVVESFLYFVNKEEKTEKDQIEAAFLLGCVRNTYKSVIDIPKVLACATWDVMESLKELGWTIFFADNSMEQERWILKPDGESLI